MNYKKSYLMLEIKRLERCTGAENGFRLSMLKRELNRLNSPEPDEISPYDLNY